MANLTLQSKILSGNLSKSETVYHRECHRNIGNITLKRKSDSNDTSEPCSRKRLTRSSVEPCNKCCCFFCQGDMKEDLHEVTTYSTRKGKMASFDNTV